MSDSSPQQVITLDENQRKVTYLLGSGGGKLLKLKPREEKGGGRNVVYGQIVLVLYGIPEIRIWEDLPEDPRVVSTRGNQECELTYHGPGPKGQAPVIHLKRKERGVAMRYQNLLTRVLPLASDEETHMPLFSLETGRDWGRVEESRLRGSRHEFRLDADGPEEVTVYLTSDTIDLDTAFGSESIFPLLFFNSDYLARAKRCALRPAAPTQPVTGFHTGNWFLWFRAQRSAYDGPPRLNFYRNEDYLAKFLDRPRGYRLSKKAGGGFVWENRPPRHPG